jgi:hypothetical protein
MLLYDEALLIVCKTLTPFVTFDLLVDDKTPIPDAGKVRIGDLFFHLNEQDKKFDLHVVDSILEDLVEACRTAGFDVALGKGNLVKGDFPNIRALAMRLRTSSRPVES